MGIPKSVRNGLISVIVLVALFGAAGTAYTLFAGSSEQTEATKPATATAAPEYTAPKPVKRAPNAPVGVSVVSLLSPVAAGANTSLSIRTTPEAVCTISVTYNGVASTDSGLSSKTADAYGMASWTWTVGSTVPPGNWPVKLNCSYQGRSAVLNANLQVVKP